MDSIVACELQGLVIGGEGREGIYPMRRFVSNSKKFVTWGKIQYERYFLNAET